jgi:3D (Asp-Asp-Asp) domain-containing protein
MKRRPPTSKFFSRLCGLVLISLLGAGCSGDFTLPFGLTDEGSFGGERSIFGAVTFYGYDDNDNGAGTRGSAAIAYPGLHRMATEDVGSYERPSTFATDRRIAPRGSRIYIPKFRKYYIMEDLCGACKASADRGQVKVDLFMGGNTALQGQPLVDCQRAHTTADHSEEIIFNPGPHHPVDPTPLFKDGVCHDVTY